MTLTPTNYGSSTLERARNIDPFSSLPRQTTVTESELSTVSRVRALYNQARQAKAPYVRMWQNNYRIVHNRPWSYGALPDSYAKDVSEIFPIVAALVGWMTDPRPNIGVVPAPNPHITFFEFLSEIARDLETVLTANWINYAFDATVMRVLWDAAVYGTGVFKSVWDPSASNGLGDALLLRSDPFAILPDPAGTSFDDINYIFEVRNTSLQDIARRYPGQEGRVVDGIREQLDTAPSSQFSRLPLANPGAISPNTVPLWGRPGGGRVSGTDTDQGVTVYECWVRENRPFVRSYQSEDGSTEQIQAVSDRWRLIVIAGNRVLVNSPATDFFRHGRQPFSRYVLQDLGELWGPSLVEHLAPLQIKLNNVLSSVETNASIAGNPILLEPTGSGIPRTQIANRPGQRLAANTTAIASIKWLEPPNMPPYIINLIQFYIGEMERVSGLSSIVRGNMPTGRNAAEVVDAVQESAFVRVRLALRSLELSLRDAGRLLAGLISENYTAPRYVSIVGPTGERTSMTLSGRHFYCAGPSGAVPLAFSLWIQAGASLPVSRQTRAAEADTLFAMGGIDRQALLEAHDYPARTEILRRIKQLEAIGLFNPPGARQRAHRSG